MCVLRKQKKMPRKKILLTEIFVVIIGAITQAVTCFQCTYYNKAIPSLSAVNCTCIEDSNKEIVSFLAYYQIHTSHREFLLRNGVGKNMSLGKFIFLYE